MKKILLPLFLSASLQVLAQTFEWVQGIGASSFYVEAVWDAKLIPGGNDVVAVGTFGGTPDFDPGPGVLNFTASGQDGYVLRVDQNDNLIWAYHIGGSGAETPKSVHVAANGDVFVAGMYTATMDFDPGAGSATLTPLGATDVFVLKLNAAGAFQWVRSLGGTNVDEAISIAQSPNGNLIVAGIFQGTIDLDPGAGTSDYNTIGAVDMYVCALNSSGDFVWGGSFGSNNYDQLHAMEVDDQNAIYLAGNFQGTADMDPGNGNYSATSNGSSDLFLSKISASGSLLWCNTVGGSMPENAFAIEIKSNGNVLLGGAYSSTCDFDPSGNTANLSAYQGYDGFVAEYTTAGSFVTVLPLEGVSDQEVRSIQYDDLGNLFLSGNFTGEMDIDPGSGSYALQNQAGQDIFFVKWNAQNTPRWGYVYTGADFDFVRNFMSNTSTGELYVCGCFTGLVDFNVGPGTNNLTADANGNGFLVKMSCPTESVTLDINSCTFSYTLNTETYTSSGTYQQILESVGGCDSVITLNLNLQNSASSQTLTVCDPTFASPSGNYFWSTSGTYYDTIPNAAGCDSVLTFILTFVQVDVGVTLTGNGLVANAIGASYQWIDCTTGQDIPGATNAVFLPTVNGDYAVMVTINGCIDTSPCSTINNAGLDQIEALDIFAYPNPASAQLHIVGSAAMQTVILYDLSGKITAIEHLTGETECTVPTAHLQDGVYLLEVKSMGRTVRTRITIQH